METLSIRTYRITASDMVLEVGPVSVISLIFNGIRGTNMQIMMGADLVCLEFQVVPSHGVYFVLDETKSIENFVDQYLVLHPTRVATTIDKVYDIVAASLMTLAQRYDFPDERAYLSALANDTLKVPVIRVTRAIEMSAIVDAMYAKPEMVN